MAAMAATGKTEGACQRTEVFAAVTVRVRIDGRWNVMCCNGHAAASAVEHQ